MMTIISKWDIYLAGPLFTKAEQDFNTDLADCLRNRGLSVFLPQEACADHEENFARIFYTCKDNLLIADAVVAILDGSDADSGTCFEVGLAYASKIPVLGILTDIRKSGDTRGFNAMLLYGCQEVLEAPSPQWTISDIAARVNTWYEDNVDD